MPKKTAAKKKTAVKTAVSPLNGAVIPVGAHPGNTGGKPGRSGRIPLEVRQAALGGAAIAVPKLTAMVENSQEPGIVIAASRELLKYGLGTKDEMTVVSPEVTARLQRQVDLINTREIWTKEELLSALDPIWQ